MTANGNGKARPGRLDVDDSLRDWIFLAQGGVAYIGKLVGETEDGIRKEQKAGKTPHGILHPVFVVAPHVFFDPKPDAKEEDAEDDGPLEPQADLPSLRTIHQFDLLGRMFLGRNARLPIHAELTAFAYLSAEDEEVRRRVVNALREVDRSVRAAEIGLISAIEEEHLIDR